MGTLKAPGPDGMPVLFYKYYWSIVGADFVNTVQSFFLSARMYQTLNMSNLVLIPKVDQPTSINHFRPISLCNVTYKVISKVLANRIKPLLSKFICPT